MGLTNLFSFTSDETGHLTRLFSGSFTVDSEGRIITTTLPRSFSESTVRDIAAHVITAFREAKKAEIPLTELVLHFSALKITAREMRGGAIVFLAPENPK